MPIMTNAEAFEYDFGIYATELWSMPEDKFLEWLNSECDRERPRDMVVRCKECKYKQGSSCEYSAVWVRPNGFCHWGERRTDDNH